VTVAELPTHEARRTDPHTGVRETTGFIGDGDERLFATTYEPPEAGSWGVVICPGLQADFSLNYRREVLVARALAERGFRVQRFHYRGSGNSDGDPREITAGRLADDIRVAEGYLRELGRLTGIGFLAARAGAIPAAEVAASRPGAPLALWEPTIDGERHLREITRVLLTHHLKEHHDDADGTAAAPSFDTIEASIHERGVLDVLGYGLGRPLFDDLRGRDLGRTLGEGDRPVLFVQLTSTDKIRRSTEAAAESLRALGCRVTLAAVRSEEPWWFTSDGWVPIESRPTTTELIGTTVDWFVSARDA
jgi:hypothetical protein